MQKKIYLVVFMALASYTFAQQAIEIDTKSLKLPKYTNLAAITSVINTPQQGMMVYNQGTATNWYYNGSNWVNLAMASATPEEAEGFGSWGCDQSALRAYQPVGNANAENNDNFGYSVSISGEYAIVGAPFENEGFTDNGSVTIFKINGSTGLWESQDKLTNPAAENSDYFGHSVTISGDYAIIGAYKDDEGGFTDNGSATIFKRNSSTDIWESQGKLTNLASGDYDYFGSSVSISGDYAIVGAYQDDEGGFSNNGSATIFKRNNSSGVWESQGKLSNPFPASNDFFGRSVSISGDYAIVGAYGDDEGGFSNNGSATIFKRNSSTDIWESQGKLTNPSPANSDNFGYSVSISGGYAIVGAYNDDEGGFSKNGSATIFKRNSSTDIWESQGKLSNPFPASNDFFGRSVSISGDYAIVGAYRDDEGFTDNGSASIYKRYGESWRLLSKAIDPSSANFDDFGTSCAIDGSSTRFIIGSQGISSDKGLAIFGKVK